MRAHAPRRTVSTIETAAKAVVRTTAGAMSSATVWIQHLFLHPKEARPECRIRFVMLSRAWRIAATMQVLRNVIVYPKSSSVKDEPLIVLAYDGTKESFARLHQDAAKLVELRALGANQAVVELLTALERGFDEFYLASIDCILIQRIGQQIVRINNPAGKSGRAVLIELNEVRQGTMVTLKKAKAKMVARMIAGIVFIAVVAGVVYTKRATDAVDKKFEDVKKLLEGKDKRGASCA